MKIIPTSWRIETHECFEPCSHPLAPPVNRKLNEGGGGGEKGGEGGGGVAGWRGVVAGWRVRRVKEADRGVVETREVKRKQRGRLLGCNLEE